MSSRAPRLVVSAPAGRCVRRPRGGASSVPDDDVRRRIREAHENSARLYEQLAMLNAQSASACLARGWKHMAELHLDSAERAEPPHGAARPTACAAAPTRRTCSHGDARPQPRHRARWTGGRDDRPDCWSESSLVDGSTCRCTPPSDSRLSGGADRSLCRCDCVGRRAMAPRRRLVQISSPMWSSIGSSLRARILAPIIRSRQS